jgi:Xaa-Pro aminopeptidase
LLKWKRIQKIFSHGTSHHIGLDVHDPGLYNSFEADMVVTVELNLHTNWEWLR